MLSPAPHNHGNQRRQRSLEPAFPVNNNIQHWSESRNAHRRGLSLDQRRSMHLVPTDQFGYGQFNNTNQQFQQLPEAQQHLQETQQHRTSQPGLDTHIPLNTQFTSASPALSKAQAEVELQLHKNWFNARFGSGQANVDDASGIMGQLTQPYMAGVPLTPKHNVIHPIQTVPNTPQRGQDLVADLEAARLHRSQSYQYDTTPMSAVTAGDIFSTPFTNTSTPMAAQNFIAYNGYSSDQSYASSDYTSSLVDATSPAADHDFSNTIMPTLPEESAFIMNNAMLSGPDSLLTAAAGVVDDVRALQQSTLLAAPQPYSPRLAALQSLGDINASIEETGISTEQVNQYVSEQSESDSKWTCLYPDCGKKFGRRENIRAHVQTHLGDRQFKCNHCGKCFVRQHDLKRHAKIHSGIKENRCDCGMSFARHDALTRHRQRGTCIGALPGCEKNESEKKKRGRPRKQRPDIETRVEKAARSRQMAAMNKLSASPTLGAQDLDTKDFVDASGRAGSAYAGSEWSVASDHSSPLTPPPSSDMDDMLFEEFMTDTPDSAATMPMPKHTDSSWLMNTPPSSPGGYQPPKTIAPTLLSRTADIMPPTTMDQIETAMFAWADNRARNTTFV